MESLVLPEDVAARYKIEITFGKERTRMNSVGCVQILESGAALHGGGDIKLFWCPNDDCGLPMDYSSKAAGPAFCEHCGLTHEAKDLVGEKFFRLPVQKLSLLVEKTFHQLGGHADIYVKYHPTDLRRATLDYKGRDQEVSLGKARVGRQRPYIYPLKNIIKDTAAGATLSSRIKAFLNT